MISCHLTGTPRQRGAVGVGGEAGPETEAACDAAEARGVERTDGMFAHPVFNSANSPAPAFYRTWGSARACRARPPAAEVRPPPAWARRHTSAPPMTCTIPRSEGVSALYCCVRPGARVTTPRNAAATDTAACDGRLRPLGSAYRTVAPESRRSAPGRLRSAPRPSAPFPLLEVSTESRRSSRKPAPVVPRPFRTTQRQPRKAVTYLGPRGGRIRGGRALHKLFMRALHAGERQQAPTSDVLTRQPSGAARPAAPAMSKHEGRARRFW